MNALIQRFQQLGPAEFTQSVFNQRRPLAWALQPLYVTDLQIGHLAMQVSVNRKIGDDKVSGAFERAALCVIADLAAEVVIEASTPPGLRACVQGMAVEYLAPTLMELLVYAAVDLKQASNGTEQTATVEFKDVQGVVVCRATLVLDISTL